MSFIIRDVKRRVNRLEVEASATHWVDRQAASHRKSLRALAAVCELIRKRFLLMGLDPALAVSLRHGEDAAAELAAIPDSEALRMADEAITHTDLDDRGEAGSRLNAEIERIAAHIIREGVQLNFADASVAELLAYCVAIEKLAWVIDCRPSEQTVDLPDGRPPLRARERVPRVPKPDHHGGCGGHRKWSKAKGGITGNVR
jgi:hypothetical protein